jgi:hypothetical protein
MIVRQVALRSPIVKQKNDERPAYASSSKGVLRSHFGPLQAQIEDFTHVSRLRLVVGGIKISSSVANICLTACQ